MFQRRATAVRSSFYQLLEDLKGNEGPAQSNTKCESEGPVRGFFFWEESSKTRRSKEIELRSKNPALRQGRCGGNGLFRFN